jgi:hypothetical protein
MIMNEYEVIPEKSQEETVFQENTSVSVLTMPCEDEQKMAVSLPEEEKSPFKRKEKFSEEFDVFKKVYDEETLSEKKLQLVIDFMENSLVPGKTPHFRSFWEARSFCLPLFKESISPAVRLSLWNKYTELSKQAKHLKELLDEQSAFAVEQIEIALAALEQQIQNPLHSDKANFFVQETFPQALKANFDLYLELQKELNVLNTHAARINELRKELLKTEMRVRSKNKFFQRLSLAGDNVFPKRKELIRQVSQQFTDDVDQFIQTYFSQEPVRESFYVLREEIKGLQGLAKFLTLNTQAFTQTRGKLSECWDQIKVEEKERKKERAQQRVHFKQNAEEVEQLISSLHQSLEKNEISSNDALKNIENIGLHMRKVELGRDEVKALRDALQDVRKKVQGNIRSVEEARQQKDLEASRVRREKFFVLKEQAELLVKNNETLDENQLVEQREAIIQSCDSSLTKVEKQELERIMKPLRDMIAEKKEKNLLSLSEDDRHALQQLKSILVQRKERRQEVKTQLEELRKAAGSSALDFEKAMNYNNQIHEEKERLEKANQAIQEIEKNILILQEKIRTKP